ncbi:hypothetical protein [Agathobaculum sp.]|uniref:hypothetical protein n=1 Tax=Agathobaculum sp. TaxID=2048138 RepID=UPI002A81427B|nr:hypothetical protein [Agathobaculum sp.]MCI5704025.1 hypothetical protein [Pseudoflavonifractor sp.]MDY3618915.1 hypothetical protein [Agathobaculum sp.]
MKRRLAFLALFVFMLSACGKEVDVVEPEANKEPPQNPQSQVLDQAEQAGLLDKEEPEEKELSAEDAAARVTETLIEGDYTAALTDTQLQVGADEGEAHDYYVFDIQDAVGASLGQVAVDKATGDKYTYLGDGMLDDYTKFPLYDPSVDAVCDWAGEYKGPAGVALEVLQGDPNSFEYIFSDGTTGNAQISGNTAKSTDGEINFLFSEGVITVAGGTVTGNYTTAQ